MTDSADGSNHAHDAQHEHSLKHADGSWKYTNELAEETSPYLLQHAHNPVHWRPWTEDAFDEARRLGKPIFLSVGYSTCYWCHVMERKVFENPVIAEQMNAGFVNIKVDREERPDVDDIYMNAVQAMRQRGGWPMSVFLTPPGAAGDDDPGLKPFFAGTYFPPEPAHGMPSFPQVLEGLAAAWTDQRDKVLQQAGAVAEAVQESLGARDAAGALSADMVQSAANQLLRSYDPTHGGFGQAPKFPTPNNLQFLLAVYQNNQSDDLWHALTHSLERMARGGIYDQVGGGFHRYSTDEKWLVPHFEKMLYDNGQLLETYVTLQQLAANGEPITGDPDFCPRIIRQTADYVIREMTDASGAFWSAQDAEVDAEEGQNYLWLPDDIEAALDDSDNQSAGNANANATDSNNANITDDLVAIAMQMFGLDEGVNFQDPHVATAPPKNVLFLPQPMPELAAAIGMSLPDLIATKATIDAKLLAVRDQRKQPGTDDKVLTAWNAMMIAGLARAGELLNEPTYVSAAGRAADAILRLMRDDAGGLLRTMRERVAKIPAFLEDHALFIHALIQLHRADSADPVRTQKWLDAAVEMITQARTHFADPEGGFFDTRDAQPDLFVRLRNRYDGAIPAGNSQMAHSLMDLYETTDDAAYLDEAVRLLESFAGSMEQLGQGMAHMLHALLRAMTLAPDRIAASAANAATQSPKRQVLSVDVQPHELDLSTGSATFVVTLDVGDDYHLNAHEPGDAQVIPTTLWLKKGAGLKLEVNYPAGIAKQYPFAEDSLHVYEGQVTLEGRVSRENDQPISDDVRLMLSYQICTAESCLDPRESEMPLTFIGASRE